MANMGKQYVSSRPHIAQKKNKKELPKFPQPAHNDIAPSATTDLSDYRQPQPGDMIANVMKSQSTSKSSSPPNSMVGKQLQAPRPNTEIAIPNPPTQLKATPRTNFPMAGVVQPKMTIGRPNDLYGQGFESIATPEVQLKAERVGSTHQQPAQLQQHPSTETLSTLGGVRAQHGKGGMTGNSQVTSEVSRPNKTGLPDSLKTGIENLSGYSMDDVRVHYNSEKPAQLQAHAYTQGTDIHVASGQEKHLPHEAWHVVQQKQGRVKERIQEKGVQIEDEEGLEREADVMGRKVMQGRREEKVQEGENGMRENAEGIKKLIRPGNTLFGKRNLLLPIKKGGGKKVIKQSYPEPQNTVQTLKYKNENDEKKEEVVGKEMNAELHPTEPMQGSATTSTKDDLYDELRYESRERIYVKGHLLNGNLGGFGIAENLFPITQKANQEHSRRVEEPLKKLVRDLYNKIQSGELDPATYVRYVVTAVADKPNNFEDSSKCKFICQVRVHKYKTDKKGKRLFDTSIPEVDLPFVIEIESEPEEDEEGTTLEDIGWNKVGVGKRSGGGNVSKGDANVKKGERELYLAHRVVKLPEGGYQKVSGNELVLSVVSDKSKRGRSPDRGLYGEVENKQGAKGEVRTFRYQPY